jgi:hypothetical protein
VLVALEEELDRGFPLLRRAEPPAYFVSYSVEEEGEARVSASNGALIGSTERRARLLEVQVRVGDYELDSTRKVAGDFFARFSFGRPAALPVEDDPAAIRLAVWRETNDRYRDAAEAFLKVQTSSQVKAKSEEEAAADFSREEPRVSVGPLVSLSVDRKVWEEKLRRYARVFRRSPGVHNTNLAFEASARNHVMVNSEGTRLQFGETIYHLSVSIESRADDGMELHRYASFHWRDPRRAPSDETVLAEVEKIARELEALRTAAPAEPFAGPAILTGRAAGVFFHEVFGHRAEGHRQKDVEEGQTFAKKIGQQIMPAFVSIYDDPTAERLGTAELAGHYPFDDEGVPAQRVVLVEKGVLKNFLLSRAPLKNFAHSNGHGRRQMGFAPVARQGNLLVEAAETVPYPELRRRLLDEVKRQGKPYGLVFEDIAGGFTFTERWAPQVYQVIPLVVYRIFADGRPDELVRGVDFVGTPLLSLEKILAASDRREVFNGFCGAESGAVPVAAAAPAILVGEIEVQKKPTGHEKPPLLPPPAHDPAAKKQP